MVVWRSLQTGNLPEGGYAIFARQSIITLIFVPPYEVADGVDVFSFSEKVRLEDGDVTGRVRAGVAESDSPESIEAATCFRRTGVNYE